ncbi:MAG TPA: nucleotide exchange factor GrpE [Spongiibacteraceae bacterium]|nr:nucleotide exchange factor GrpE [Spongiibacteraceae bacterium]HUH36804.1 nucleotide exchange factor GrpE [Spongiibacteraceae bacterium]
MSEDQQTPSSDVDNPGVATAAGAEQPEQDVAQLRQQLEEARQQAAEARDQALRAVAEADNVRRRAEKDIENARKFALERFAGEMVGVVDNLERALEAASGEHAQIKPLIEGVDLTLKNLLTVLNRFQITQIDPVGEPFDPQFHEAMSMVESRDAEPNTVLHVVQKGYVLNGRLLRAAMVVVAKASAGHVDETV